MSYKTEFKTTPMEGRFAWCFLDQPRTEDMNGKKLETPRYECAFYFPKTDRDPNKCRNYAFFGALAFEVVQNAYRGQWPMIGRDGSWTDWPIDDCDADTDGIAKYPWQSGMWRVRLSAGKFRPRVFDPGNNLIDLGVDGKFRPGTFKGSDGIGGDFGLASVNAYEWEFGQARKGVSFGVEGIKVTQQGDQIGGGGRPVEAMFGSPTGQPVFGGAPPVPQYAPSAGAPPAPTASQSYQPPSATYPPASLPNGGATTAYPTSAPAPYAPAPQPGGMPPVPPTFGQR